MKPIPDPDAARHSLKARITDYGADCAGHKVAGKGSLADALTAADAYAEAHARELREGLRQLLAVNEAGYEFCKQYPEKFVPAAEGMAPLPMADFVVAYEEARALVGEP